MLLPPQVGNGERGLRKLLVSGASRSSCVAPAEWRNRAKRHVGRLGLARSRAAAGPSRGFAKKAARVLRQPRLSLVRRAIDVSCCRVTLAIRTCVRRDRYSQCSVMPWSETRWGVEDAQRRTWFRKRVGWVRKLSVYDEPIGLLVGVAPDVTKTIIWSRDAACFSLLSSPASPSSVRRARRRVRSRQSTRQDG